MKLIRDDGTLDIPAATRIMDVAADLRRQELKLEDLLEGNRREEARDRILNAAEATGEVFTAKQIDAAIDEYIGGLNVFQPPKWSFETALAHVYVARDVIWNRVVKPTLAIGAIGTLITGAGIVIQNEVRNYSERAVESKIEISYTLREKRSEDARMIGTHEGLENIADEAQSHLRATDSFFEMYLIDGSARDTVTRDNYERVSGELEEVTESLNAADAAITRGNTIIQEAEKLVALTDRTKRLYDRIAQIAIEPAAKKKGDDLYRLATHYSSAKKLGKLEQATNDLAGLQTTLLQAYTLQIVSRSGVKSGIDRYYTDEHGKRSAGFYLIVEAVDNQGNRLQLPITNVETQLTQTVSRWGERVPQYVYEKVKQDKTDDGIIQEGTVGRKERGYLNPTISVHGLTERLGQITRW